MPAQPTKDLYPDDIDLIGVLERLVMFLRRFGMLFIVAVVIGVAAGIASYTFAGKSYESKLILHSSVLTNQEELEIIDYWNQLLQRNGRDLLAGILHCPADLLQKTQSLEGVEIQKNYSSTDPNGYYIRARVSDTRILPQLQQAIVDGLNNSEYVRKKIDTRALYLRQMIDKTSAQVIALDSTVRRLQSSPATAAAVNFGGMQKDLVDLNEKLFSYRNDLALNAGVQVLQSFIPFNTPVSRSLRTSILIGVIGALAVAYLYAMLKYVEERLKKRAARDA